MSSPTTKKPLRGGKRTIRAMSSTTSSSNVTSSVSDEILKNENSKNYFNVPAATKEPRKNMPNYDDGGNSSSSSDSDGEDYDQGENQLHLFVLFRVILTSLYDCYRAVVVDYFRGGRQ